MLYECYLFHWITQAVPNNNSLNHHCYHQQKSKCFLNTYFVPSIQMTVFLTSSQFIFTATIEVSCHFYFHFTDEQHGGLVWRNVGRARSDSLASGFKFKMHEGSTSGTSLSNLRFSPCLKSGTHCVLGGQGSNTNTSQACLMCQESTVYWDLMCMPISWKAC